MPSVLLRGDRTIIEDAPIRALLPDVQAAAAHWRRRVISQMTTAKSNVSSRRKRNSTAVRGFAVLQDLLAELALVLLPRGMTPKRFAELARSAFVRVAADMSKLPNGRVNYSRVSAQTGVTRADVRRLLRHDATSAADQGQTALERVIDGWRIDREFVDRSGRPRRLQIFGRRASFVRLVTKYGGDVPYRAILDELRRIGVVTEAAGRVQLQASLHLRRLRDFAFLSPVMPALVDGLRIASAKAAQDRSSSIYRLSLPAKTELDMAILRDRCSVSAQSMLEGLSHSLGTQVTIPQGKGRRIGSIVLTILLAEDRGKRSQRTR